MAGPAVAGATSRTAPANAPRLTTTATSRRDQRSTRRAADRAPDIRRSYARRATAGSPRPSAPTQVSGWIEEDSVVSLLRHVAGYIDYAYDDLDEQALVGALDPAGSEDGDAWFDYPLHGSPVLTVWLARSPGTAIVMVRIEGLMDDVLAARVETLIDVLCSPRA